MADRSIIFSAPMVRALLECRKTQTRRILKRQPIPFAVNDEGTLCDVGLLHVKGDRLPRVTLGRVISLQEVPYAVGDRLWVREAHTLLPRTAYRGSVGTGTIEQREHPTDGYSAAVFREGFDRSGRPRWRPSIHMPRWASRLTLAVTEVRVERLNDITEVDAIAEGVVNTGRRDGAPYEHFTVPGCNLTTEHEASTAFSALWESINGDGAWAANPWVAAITFEVHRANIDEIPSPVVPTLAQGDGT